MSAICRIYKVQETIDSCMLSDRRQLLHSVVGMPLVTVDDGTISQMPLHDGEECLYCSVRDGHHHSQCWRLAGIDHPELLCGRTPSMVFGLMPEQTLIDLNNNSWSSKHQWGVNIDDSPTANIPEILVCLYGTLLSYLGLLGSITNGILPYPPIHQHHALFQGQFRFFKETPIPQTQRLPAVRV